MSKTAKTAEQVKREFRDAGITISEWARVNGFKRMSVIDVLRGKNGGHWGESHEIAVSLGLKVGNVVDVAKFKPRKQAA